MVHLAATHGLGDVAVKRIQEAYFADGLQIADRETLALLLAEVGVDLDEARTVALGSAYADAVVADRERADELGVGSVPFFVFDERWVVSGAQSAWWVLEMLRRCRDQSHARSSA